MPYPLSSAVQPGDPTLADQYNQLRSDALRLGASESEAVSLAELLRAYRSPLRFSIYGTTLQLEASENDPCALLINGFALETKAPLTLTPTGFPAGERIDVCALRSDGSPSFTLTAKKTSEPIGTNERKLAELTLTPESTIESFRLTDADSVADPDGAGEGCAARCDGRLTLVSGNPCPAFDVPSADTLCWTPYQGNEIALLRPNQGWRTYRFDELHLSLSGMDATTCQDIFVGKGAAGVELRSVPWSSLTNRAQPLARRDGVLVLEADPGLRYVGTIALSGAGKTRDRLSERNIWNLYGQEFRPLRKSAAAAQLGPAAVSRWAPYARDKNAVVSAVIGLSQGDFSLTAAGSLHAVSAGSYAVLGIAIDADLDDPDLILNSADLAAHAAAPGPLHALISSRGTTRHLGKHVYAMISYSSGPGQIFNGSFLAQDQIGLCGGFYG